MNSNHIKLRSFCCYGLLASALCLSGSAIAQRPTTQFLYDANGNVTSAVDGLNRPTVQQYDAFNRLRRITQPPPAAMQPNPVIQLELNGRDELTRVIDPRNLPTTYGVTGLSDVTTQTSPDAGVTTRTFDAAGNVKTSRDAGGRTTTYAYDALHRLTQALYGDGTSSNYVYDQGANGVGRLTSMTDPGPITTSWTYTAMGRVATKRQTIGTGATARTHQLTYNYNPTTGQLVSVTYPSGKVISHTYGAATQDLERIAINGAAAASSITYHPFGGVKRMTLGNGQVWSNSLDQDGRVVTYTLGAVTYTVAWDAANRITGITSSQTATNRTFGYDNLDRITSFAATGRSQGFGYDATGNLLTKSDMTGAMQTNYTFTIAPTSNRMTGISNLGIGYSFDAAGNRTGDGRITYAYNQRGRMNQVRIINGTITNTYDYLINGINLRVKKTGPSTVVPQGTRIFVYDDSARLIGEYDDLGRARIEHVWLDDRPIAAITHTYTGTSMTPATTLTSYVETDHLATPRLITNAARQKRWTWESAPYGDTFPNENPQSLGAYNYNLRFPGQYFDAETNHHYNHHRDYESTTGRYVQSDPIGLYGGLNVFLYGNAAPLFYVDPLGLLGWRDALGFVPVVGSTLDAYDAARCGYWGTALFNLGLAAMDATGGGALIKGLAVGTMRWRSREAIREVFESSSDWDSMRRGLQAIGEIPRNTMSTPNRSWQTTDHIFFKQRGNGPHSILNHPANLQTHVTKSLNSQFEHMGMLERAAYLPTWMTLSAGGLGSYLTGLGVGSGCGCD